MDTMDTSLGRALTQLSKGAMLRIRDGQGKGIAVFHGQAWITQDSDPRDLILGAGESFSFDRPGLAIVQALEDTTLLVFEADPTQASRRHSLQARRITSDELHRIARLRRRQAAPYFKRHLPWSS